MTSSTNPYRLGRAVVPSAYRLFITPDFSTFTFTGRVEVEIEVLESTSELTLHALELDLHPAVVRRGPTARHSREVRLDPTYETATFVFDEPLERGPATLEIDYTGTISAGLEGFYRSTYVDGDGVEHVIGTTQFENTDARRAFPCWDEPIFKATFQVNLTVPVGLAAYSNSPIVAETDLGDGRRSIAFAPSMKMSTYLVAWVIGPFEESRTLDVDGVPLRVIAPLGKVHLADVALEAAEFCLRWFGDYFAIPYPGEKLDMIAIPDFAMGAMENVGCITYRETALLVDPSTASQAERFRVVEVVLHEIAHQWFGNLVTMEWWEGIWLNEAFATFMQLVCTDAFRPQWKTWVGQNYFRDLALQIDGLSATRAIEFEVVSPDDTQAMFDLLTYEKGASVLRMLEQFLGAETFRDGMRHYVAKHQYANARTTDLWDALEEVSGQPVREMMNTWILQGGHPLVTYADRTLSQAPFSYAPKTPDSQIGDHWLVPVATRSVGGGQPTQHLLGRDPLTVTEAAPVVANAGGWGCYRTRYGLAELEELAPHIPELDDLERTTMVDDAWAALLARLTTWEQFRLVIANLGDHVTPAAWEAIGIALDTIRRPLDAAQRATLIAQVRAIALPQYERLGWDAVGEEDELTPRMRAAVIRILGGICEDEAIRAEALRRYEAGDVHGDLAGTILRLVASLNRPGDYEAFLEHYRAAATPQDEMRYLSALGSFPDERVGLDAARRCFEEFRAQDAPLILPLLTMNERSGPAVWRYIASRWDDAKARFAPSQLARLASGTPTFLADPDLAAEVIAFHTAHPVPGGYPATVEQQLERLRVGLLFAEAIRAQFA
ncbi:MAG TPA: M1 family metallopeptidase [Acidimicrobiales bacterium]|nr:M1 family metallopeptidase [Acidimicrobiales bacterium]